MPEIAYPHSAAVSNDCSCSFMRVQQRKSCRRHHGNESSSRKTEGAQTSLSLHTRVFFIFIAVMQHMTRVAPSQLQLIQYAAAERLAGAIKRLHLPPLSLSLRGSLPASQIISKLSLFAKLCVVLCRRSPI